jgi:hypothetical protein
MRRFFPFAVLTFAAAGACGPAQEPVAAPLATVAPGTLQPPPVHALIGYRAALQLTSEQITVLDSIGQQLQSEHQALMRRLTDLRGGRPITDPRGGGVVPGEEGRAVIEEIRQNNLEAMQGVEQVLTEEQRTQTCQIFRDTDRRLQRRGEGRPAAGQPMDRQRRPAAAPPEAPTAATWAWCVAERPAAS